MQSAASLDTRITTHQGICLLNLSSGQLVVQLQPGLAAPAVAVPAVRLSCSCIGTGFMLAVRPCQ